jgi:hypothetical protein
MPAVALEQQGRIGEYQTSGPLLHLKQKSHIPKTHLNFIFPSTFFGLFPSGFLTKFVYVFLHNAMHAICPTKLNLFDLGTLIK